MSMVPLGRSETAGCIFCLLAEARGATQPLLFRGEWNRSMEAHQGNSLKDGRRI